MDYTERSKLIKVAEMLCVSQLIRFAWTESSLQKPESEEINRSFEFLRGLGILSKVLITPEVCPCTLSLRPNLELIYLEVNWLPLDTFFNTMTKVGSRCHNLFHMYIVLVQQSTCNKVLKCSEDISDVSIYCIPFITKCHRSEQWKKCGLHIFTTSLGFKKVTFFPKCN